MGLDELHLRVLASSSDLPVERKNAQKGMSSPTLYLWLEMLNPDSPETFEPRTSLGSRRTSYLYLPRPNMLTFFPPRFFFLAMS